MLLYFKVCYFGNRYYEDSYGFARIYGTNTYTLETDWVTDNPVYWYQFRQVIYISTTVCYTTS